MCFCQKKAISRFRVLKQFSYFHFVHPTSEKEMPFIIIIIYYYYYYLFVYYRRQFVARLRSTTVKLVARNRWRCISAAIILIVSSS